MTFDQDEYSRLKKLYGFQLAVAKKQTSSLNSKEDEYASLLLHDFDKQLTTIVNNYSDKIGNDLIMLNSMVALMGGVIGLMVGFIEKNHDRKTADGVKIICEERIDKYRRITLGDK